MTEAQMVRLVPFLTCPAGCGDIELTRGCLGGPMFRCKDNHLFGLVHRAPEFYPTLGKDPAGFSIRWKNHQVPQGQNEFWKTFYERPDLEGKVVLDAGCGIGRYSANALSLGAKEVISLDMSEWAIKGVQQNAPEALAVQGSLLDMPIKDSVIDCAFSIGVLHHTPDPRRAFLNVAKTVKPGGLFSCWVYENREQDPTVRAAQELLHEITKACPPDALHAAIAKFGPKVRDAYDKQWGPLMRVLRVSVQENDEDCISDTVDWHAPRYRFHHTVEEVQSWYEEAGFTVLKQGIKQFKTAFLGRKR